MFLPEVISSSDIGDIAPKDRKCYFPHEGNLSLYSRYTLNNCRWNLLFCEHNQMLSQIRVWSEADRG